MLAFIILFAVLAYFVYEYFYFKSDEFGSIKNSISIYTVECNELNAYIEDLKRAYLDVKRSDFGNAQYVDNSVWRFKSAKLKGASFSNNIYDCSLTVCRNAQQQPFKYLCKYFNIKPTEDSLQQFEDVLNKFCAAEQGKVLLKQRKDELIENVSKQIPFLVRSLRKKTIAKKLGFQEIDFSEVYFPKYSFRYISAGGNKSISCDIVFNITNLERFINYLSGIVKFRKSVAGQRALMTPSLREKIKARDNYTCQCCKVSLYDEPHLLLEIDHIVPLSKGGLTSEDNLQTLCWKCNRSKGAKLGD